MLMTGWDDIPVTPYNGAMPVGDGRVTGDARHPLEETR